MRWIRVGVGEWTGEVLGGGRRCQRRTLSRHARPDRRADRIFTISRESGSARRAYRIECPDEARIYTDPADSHETILIPGPEHRQHADRSVWLRLDDAVHAAREGRYGLRLVAEEELPAANAPEVASVRVRRPDAEDCAMNRRHFLATGAIGLVAWATTTTGFACETSDPRSPATIAAEVGGKPGRLALTGTAPRTVGYGEFDHVIG